MTKQTTGLELTRHRLFCEVLKETFPWLGTDADAGSGADVIAQLSELYEALQPITIYCNNNPCKTEAVGFYLTENGARFYLCYSCKEAFELGQVNPHVNILGLDQHKDFA